MLRISMDKINKIDDNKIEIKSIQELLGMKFFIPSFQRGYRWTKQQVEDLLNDVDEFENKDDNWYCLQPLVVKRIPTEDAIENIAKLFSDGKRPNSIDPIKEELEDKWEVIDGQQRLTTIFIILKCLARAPDEKMYSIEYETRKDSAGFWNKINSHEKNSEDNIDYFHMRQAMETINKWFNGKDSDKKYAFKVKLLQNVKFIWYETTESDPIKVFTRLNIGKIPLTNSELIKALLLNRSNFEDGISDDLKIRLRQQEIASQWDNIEYTLQNDEFWLFIHELSYNNPTRIDFIFDLICDLDIFGNNKKFEKIDNIKDDIGTDDYKTFRYFYLYVKRAGNKNDILANVWGEVRKIFQTLKNWYDDLTLYHYIGYLIEQKTTISDLYKEWNKEGRTQEAFINEIIKKIKKSIKDCNDLNKEYEISGSPKTQCKPLLLLHNIQTVINQNKALVSDDKYKLPVFYKFPFHLYKKESGKKGGKGWEVEHIASNSGDAEDLKNRKMYLWGVKYSFGIKGELKNRIDEYLVKENDGSYQGILGELKNLELENAMSDAEKNKIWNFALLDSGTN